MAADLQIHVFEDEELTEDDFRGFFGNHIGSKWFSLDNSKKFDKNYDKFSKTKSIWVGSASWLKASLLEDSDTFIPDSVGEIADIIGEHWPVVDDELISQIKDALTLENSTQYEVASADEVVEFLERHRGKKAFTISW